MSILSFVQPRNVSGGSGGSGGGGGGSQSAMTLQATSKSGNVTTSDLAVGTAGIFEDTDSGLVVLAYNQAGTIVYTKLNTQYF